VRYSKMYTKSGDQGSTMVAGGRIRKSSLQVKFLSRIDSLNCAIGRLYVVPVFEREEVRDLQRMMLNLGSVAAGYVDFNSAWLDSLLKQIEQLTDLTDSLQLSQNDWCYYGAMSSVSQSVDEVCCSARETEQLFWELYDKGHAIDIHVGTYLNALSKFLYIKARYNDHRATVQ